MATRMLHKKRRSYVGPRKKPKEVGPQAESNERGKVMTTKRTRILVTVLLSLGALIVLQPTARAEVVQMYLTSAGSDISHGVYMSPYYATIGSDPTAVAVICDDFFDDSYVPESWQAKVYAGSDTASLSNTRMAYLSGNDSQTLATDYDAVAYLALQLFAPNLTAYNRAILSFAIWDIFADVKSAKKSAPSVKEWLAADPTFLGQVKAAASDALQNPNAKGERDLLTIYVPTTQAPTCGGGVCQTAPPQEFITVRTPEASVPAFLAFNLSLFGVVFFVRRRSRRNATAAR